MHVGSRALLIVEWRRRIGMRDVFACKERYVSVGAVYIFFYMAGCQVSDM